MPGRNPCPSARRNEGVTHQGPRSGCIARAGSAWLCGDERWTPRLTATHACQRGLAAGAEHETRLCHPGPPMRFEWSRCAAGPAPFATHVCAPANAQSEPHSMPETARDATPWRSERPCHRPLVTMPFAALEKHAGPVAGRSVGRSAGQKGDHDWLAGASPSRLRQRYRFGLPASHRPCLSLVHTLTSTRVSDLQRPTKLFSSQLTGHQSLS